MAFTSIFRKKRFVVPIILIGVLVVVRIFLPYLVKDYVNEVLAEIPGYNGRVGNIDIALIRGAYIIDSLYLNKVDAESEIPFVKFERADISVQWNALLEGRIVGEVVLTRPELIYVSEDQTDSSVTDTDDWSKALTDLVPIEINHLEIREGKMAFVELTAEPVLDLYLNDISLSATNLRNVVNTEEKLPSDLVASASSIGGGQVNLKGKMDLVKRIPDMDISFSLENASITALNDFTRHYAGIDFKKGNFNLFSEIAIADGFLTGYLKPILENSELIEENDGFFEKLWEGFVGLFKFILKNQKQNTLATEVPIKGDLNDVQGEVVPTILNLLKNAWVRAYKENVDDKIEYTDAKRKKN